MIKEENKRVQITFTKDRLSAIDAYAENLGISRSVLVNLALTEYLHEHQADLEIALMKRAYGM